MFKVPSAVTGGITVIVASLVDYVTPWHPVPDPFYLVPIAAFAWIGHWRSAVWAGVFGLIGFLAVASLRPATAHPLNIGAIAVTVQTLAMLGAGLLANGVHRLLRTFRRGASNEHVDDDAPEHGSGEIGPV